MQAQLFYVGIKSYIWDEWKRKQKQGALSMKTRKKVNICKIEQRKILNYAYIKRRWFIEEKVMYWIKIIVVIFTLFLLASIVIMGMGYLIVSPSGQGGFVFVLVILAGLAVLDFFLIRRLFYTNNKKIDVKPKLKKYDTKNESQDENIY